MAKVSITDLQTGSVLARDVKDANGRVLIPAGVEINDRHLRGLQMWGVRNVEIQSENDTKDADVQSLLNALPPDVLLQATTKADDLFRHADRTHPAIALLYEATLLRLATPQHQEAGPA